MYYIQFETFCMMFYNWEHISSYVHWYWEVAVINKGLTAECTKTNKDLPGISNEQAAMPGGIVICECWNALKGAFFYFDFKALFEEML